MALIKKITTLIFNPRLAIASKLRPIFRPLFRIWHRICLNRHVDLSNLKRRPHEAIPPDFSDLWLLYRLIRKNKNRAIVEYGSGCSTLVIAQALYDNEKESSKASETPIKFYSLDDDAYWAKAAEEIIPDHLKSFVKIFHCPRMKVDFKGEKCWKYKDHPYITPDFVYLDGPTFDPDRKIAIDFLDYAHQVPDNFIMVIDGRYDNTAFIKKEVGNQFSFNPRYLFSNTVVKKASD